MPENETVALEQDDAFWRKAAWLLLRRLGGEVVITDEEWARVPEEPELILARTDGAMRWIAQRRYIIPVLEPASPLAAELDGPEMPGQLPLPGTEPTRPWPYDGPEGRARLTGNTG